MKAFFIPIFAFFAAMATMQRPRPSRSRAFSTITTEIAKKVGGDKVEVAGLVTAGVDPHEYEPKPDDLKQVEQAQLILASGKHMENYTARLKESAAPNAVLLEVGDAFPRCD